MGLSDGRKTLIHDALTSVAVETSAEPLSSEKDTANQETSSKEKPFEAVGSRMIYVNGQTGDDRLDGLLATVRGTSGPKKTIQHGFGAARGGDWMTIAEGVYQVSTEIGAPNVIVQAGPNVVIGR